MRLLLLLLSLCWSAVWATERANLEEDKKDECQGKFCDFETHKRELTTPAYYFPLVLENAGDTEIKSIIDVSGDIIVCGLMNGGYNNYSGNVFALKMDPNGKITAFKIYGYLTYTAINVQCHPDPAGFVMIFAGTLQTVKNYVDSNLTVTVSMVQALAANYYLVTSHYDSNGLAFYHTNDTDFLFSCHELITDTGGKYLNLSQSGQVFKHSDHVVGHIDYHIGMVTYGSAGSTELLLYKMKTADCSDITWKILSTTLTNIVQDMDQLHIEKTAYGNLLTVLMNADSTSDQQFIFWDIDTLTFSHSFYYTPPFFATSINTIYTGSEYRVIVIGMSSSKHHLVSMIYDPAVPSLTMSAYKTLTGTTVYTNSILAIFNGAHYGVLTANHFGSGNNTSYKNPAIIKFGNDLTMVDGCYEWVTETTVTLNVGPALTVTDEAHPTINNPLLSYSNSIGSLNTYDKFETFPFYFKADGSRTDSSSATCALEMPAIDTTFTHLTEYWGSDSSIVWNVTATSPSNVPYTITVFVDNDNVTLPSMFTIDDTNISPYGFILLNMDFTLMPMTDLNTTYEITLKPLVWDLSSTETTNHSVNITVVPEPLITGGVFNSNEKIYQNWYSNLEYQSKREIDGTPSGVTVECRLKSNDSLVDYAKISDDFTKLLTNQNDISFIGQKIEYYVKIYHTLAEVRTYDFNITYSANNPPVFSTSMTNPAIPCETNINVTLPDVDDEGDQIVFSITSLPGSLPDFTKEFFVETPNLMNIAGISCDYTGTHIGLKLKVKDFATTVELSNEITFNMTINPRPVSNYSWTDQTKVVYASQGSFGSSSYCFTHKFNDPMTVNFTVDPAPPGPMLSLDTNGKCEFSFLSINQSYAQVYNVTVHAYDSYSTAAVHTTENFTLTLIANLNPSLVTAIGAQSVVAHFPFSYTFSVATFTDGDGEALTYSGSVSPSSSIFTLNPTTREITASTSNADAGVYDYTIAASDGHPDTTPATSTFQITVSINPGPAVNETIPAFNFVEGRSNAFVHTADAFSEPDSESITLSGAFTPSGSFLSYDSSTRTISGTPSPSDIGNSHSLTITAKDPWTDTSTATQTVSITIEGSLPPVFSGTPAKKTYLAHLPLLISLDTTQFSDPNNDTIHYDLSHNVTGSWVSINNPLGRLEGTPTNSDIGNFSVNYRAYDDFAKDSNTAMEFEILFNNPPQFDGGNYAYDVFALVPFEVNLTDMFSEIDGEDLTWTLFDKGGNLTWLTADDSTDKLIGTPTQISGSYNESVRIVASDPASFTVEAIIYIKVKENAPPYLTKPALSEFNCYEGVSCSVDFDQWAVDDAGENVLYWTAEFSPVLSSLTLDGTTGVLSGVPLVTEIHSYYTLTFIVSDSHRAINGENSYDYKVYILPNRSPYANSTISDIVTAAGLPISSNFAADLFVDDDGEPISYSHSVISTPSSTWINYDATTRTLSGTAPVNAGVGTYTVTVIADDNNTNSASGELNFTISVTPNLIPEILNPAVDPSCIVAHYSLNYSVFKSSYNDPEGQGIIYSFIVNDTTKGAWLSMSENATHLHFTGTPDNSQFGNIIMTIKAEDINSGLGFAEDNVTICVNQNQAAYLVGSPVAPPNGYIGVLWTYEFDLSWIGDPESDVLIHQCSINPDHGWMSCSTNSTHLVATGTPLTNTHAVEYELSIINIHAHSDIANYTWAANFTIAGNNPPTISAVTNKQMMAPDGMTWTFGASIANDPEALPLTNTIKVNGSSSIPSWIMFEGSDFTFTIVSTSNSIVGVHTVTLSTSDGFNAPATTDFTITIDENLGPTSLGVVIPDKEMLVLSSFNIEFPVVETFFTDPDGRPMTSNIRFATGVALPPHIQYNPANNTLYGSLSGSDVGNWNLVYVGMDDHPSEGTIPFRLIIKPCYYTCSTCMGDEYNQCTDCLNGYYLENNQCTSYCSDGTWKNLLAKTCETCHSYCSKCKDGTNTNCQECSDGHFYLNDTCYLSCPDGYAKDAASGNCVKCHSTCAKCTGPSSNECTECDSSQLYILTGTRCSKATCVEGYYLDKTDLHCYECDQGCDVCEYPDVHTCVSCNKNYRMTTPGICAYCNTVTGFAINDFGICTEICGDGLYKGEYECDDGDLINGNGCSNKCEIEIGYKCNQTVCSEIVSPTAIISSISVENTCTIKFSETVKFSSYDHFETNLKAKIEGAESEYEFEYKIKDADTLKTASNFTSFQVEVYDIKARIQGRGTEIIQFWFEDLSAVKDIADNNLAEGKIIGNLNPVDYIPKSEKEGAESSGNSMKFTILTVFSFNLGLKLLISTSATTMWTLIHALQVFRYILMINVQMPKIVDILMNYMAVVVGEIDEMEDMMPDWFTTYVIDSKELSTNVTLYSRFEANGYETPFLAILFSKQMIILVVPFIISFPLIYIGAKLIKCKYITNKSAELWESFFWNAPVRTFTELYIEISLAFFLNSLNTQFSTTSSKICTLIMYAVGIFVLCWPFLILNILSKPPKLLKRATFDSKFGTLTEGFHLGRTLYHRSYYILFLFQRLVITGILVIFYETTFLQILLCFGIQLMLTYFLMRIRPFKSELQQVICVSDEFAIVFSIIILFCLYRYQQDYDNSRKIAFLLVGVIALSILKNLSVIIYTVIKSSYGRLKQYIHKKVRHNKNRKKRIRKERKENQEKELKKREEEILIEEYKNLHKDNKKEMSEPIDPSVIISIPETMNSPEKNLNPIKHKRAPHDKNTISQRNLTRSIGSKPGQKSSSISPPHKNLKKLRNKEPPSTNPDPFTTFSPSPSTFKPKHINSVKFKPRISKRLRKANYSSNNLTRHQLEIIHEEKSE
ncbi:unnamed protein product [Moneuplotes crassus]|uniref:Dystroglycan-type cadherin-like domain-containing protein n=1 Tax=Euplotes crassus TaxID=5936 RepID=A0AAD1Y4Y5_EUPCR|nr:unnamed protein product [Moneuplotes crassus]